MNDLIVFSIGYAIYLLISSIYVLKENDWSITKFKKYWIFSEGNNKIGKGYLKIYLAPIILAAVFMTANSAFAKDLKWLDGGGVFVGLDCSPEPSVFCKTRGINDKCNSNMGVVQNIAKKGNVALNGKGTHHSCFANPDAIGYDKLGIELKINW